MGKQRKVLRLESVEQRAKDEIHIQLDYARDNSEFFSDPQRREAFEQAYREMAEKLAQQDILEAVAAVKGDDSLASKQQLARTINAVCRSHGLTIAHPETGEPVNLVAINTLPVGKFVLEVPSTKKRSNTTKDIATLFPLKLIRIPVAPAEEAED